MGLNIFKSLKKKGAKDPLQRRPENQADLKTLVDSIGDAHRRGEITDKQYETLLETAKKKLTLREIQQIVANSATLAGIVGAVAAVAGVAISMPGNADMRADQHDGAHDDGHDDHDDGGDEHDDFDDAADVDAGVDDY